MARPEPKRWGQAALGGLLVALAGALFGAARGKGSARPPVAGRTPAKGRGRPVARAAPQPSGRSPGGTRPKAGGPQVRTKPRPPKVAAQTRYWPPPPETPITSTAEVGEGDAGPRQPGPDGESVSRGFEVKDAKAGTIVKVMAFSVSMIAISIASLFWFVGHSHSDDARSTPLTPQQLTVIVPPGPHLQDHPLHDIAMEKKREADLLTAYAWSDPAHRTGRIPIARAQALVTGRPLDPSPAAPVPAAPASQP